MKSIATVFTSELGEPMTVPVVTAAVAYDLKTYRQNFYFSDIKRALLLKYGHEPGTHYNDASIRPRHGLMPKVNVKQTNRKQSLCVLSAVGNKAIITY